MSNAPALAPHKGVRPQLSDDWKEPWWFYVVLASCMTIMAIFILVRIYTKWKVVKKFEAADYFVISTYGISIVIFAYSLLAARHHWGAHQWNIKAKQLFDLLYYMNLLEILYAPLMLCTKLGITLQYLRMFAPNRTVNPFVFYSSWITMVLCTVFYIITTILTVYACSPREKIWNKLLVGGKCLNYRGIILSTAIFNIASDVAILMLPVHTVWNLRIPRKKKIAICFLFGTGSLACVASTMRAVYTMRIIEGGEKADVSYNSLRTALWSYTESTLGVIVACIISFPKLWKAKGGRLSAFVSQGAKKLGLRSSPQSSDDQLPQLSEIQLPAEDLKKLDSAQS